MRWVAERLVPDNAPTRSYIGPYGLSPVLSRPCNNLHRHIHCSVGLQSDSKLLSAQSHASDPSVNRLSLDIESVKTFISCLNIITGPPHDGNDSFSPACSWYCCCLHWTLPPNATRFHVDGVAIAPGRRVPIVMDCVTEPGMMFGISQIFPKDQTRRRTGSQD
jgi:hypothetical protein